MTGREKAAAGGAAVLALGITGYSAWKLIGTGILSWHASQPEFHSMMAELPVVWLVLFLIFFCDCRAARRRESTGEGGCCRTAGAFTWRSWCGAALTAAVFCWLHVSFLPAVLAACYAGYLILTGAWFQEAVLGTEKKTLCWDFLLGSAVTISVFCLLSLGNQGSIKKLRLWVIGTGVLLTGRAIWRLAGRRSARMKAECGRKRAERAETAESAESHRRCRKNGTEHGGHGKMAPGWQAAMAAAVVTLVFLQAGRMNLAVDFDSIWYGVRSHVMLDSGNGIYENLGTLGVVYTYPKGLETLTLPLAGLPSYSFIIAFNVIAAGMTLFAAYETASLFMKQKHALWVPFLMAAVPGIMNMADTAKADLMTLFCQILMLQGVGRYLKAGCAGEENEIGEGNEIGEPGTGWLAMALAAGGVSLTMKPTAVVFSTAIVGMSLFWLVWKGITGKNGLRRMAAGEKRSWLALLPAVTAGAGIWGRTLKLVGVPVTSVFYQVFQKMGFRVKYPFYASGFPSAGSGMSVTEGLRFLAGRLYGVLLNPQGDDMGHVIIAWGTVLPAVLAVLVICLSGTRKEKCVKKEQGTKKEQDAKKEQGARKERYGMLGYLAAVLAALLFIDLVSLYSLSQIDGNYYMLTYAVIILLGCGCLSQSSDFCRRSAYAVLIPVWLYGAVLCGLTNWAWALGNGGIQAVNRGYYPHMAAEREKRAAQGSQAIWDILAADPKNRIIALGEHPGVLTFPCWVQSYVDVSGYWGNPEIVADAPAFLQYLQFAEVDYLYMEKEYVDTSVRIYQIVRSLVEKGWLYDVRDENGNLILSVNHQADGSAENANQFGKGPAAAENAEKVYQSGGGLAAEEIQKNLQVFDQRYIQHP